MVQTKHQRVIGQPLSRLDGPKKVTGTAPYAFEHALKEVAYGFPVQSTIVKGQVTSIDTRAAQALEGVLTILTHENAPRLASQSDADFAVLQSDVVAYRGQFIAFVSAGEPSGQESVHGDSRGNPRPSLTPKACQERPGAARAQF